MVNTVSIRELRPKLAGVIDAIHERLDRYVITRRGKPEVIMMSIRQVFNDAVTAVRGLPTRLKQDVLWVTSANQRSVVWNEFAGRSRPMLGAFAGLTAAYYSAKIGAVVVAKVLPSFLASRTIVRLPATVAVAVIVFREFARAMNYCFGAPTVRPLPPPRTPGVDVPQQGPRIQSTEPQLEA